MPTGWTAADIPDQTGRRALITGANGGLGLQTTLALARQGTQVLLACRNPQRGQQAADRVRAGAPDARVEVVELDVADLGSVRRAARAVADGGGLDLLINNAGIMAVPQRRETVQGFELQMGTNHLGHFALTGLLLPALLDRPGSRVVTVTSLAQHAGWFDPDRLDGTGRYTAWRAYNRSKLANAVFTVELGRRLHAASAATASLGAHPGLSHTGLQYTGPRMDRSLIAIPLAIGTQLTAQPPEQGALPQLRAATDPEAAGGTCYGPSGVGQTRGLPRRVRFARAAYDQDLGARLWQRSEQLTGVAFDLPGT